jgi:hypothetical protein
MTQYILTNSERTIIWGPAELPAEWITGSDPTIPSTFSYETKTPLKWYGWTEVNADYDEATQTRSSPSLSFNDTTKTCTATYTLSDIDIDVIKIKKLEQINFIRENIFNTGYTWNGYTFDSNDSGRANLTSAALGAVIMGKAADNTAPFTSWRTMDNQDVPLTGAQLVTFGLTMLNWYSSVMAYSWAKKDSINNCATADAIRAIDLNSGWPTV